jgi:hypothetical protein
MARKPEWPASPDITTIEHGIFAGQRCAVVFLDRELKPCARAETALVKLTFANGDLGRARGDDRRSAGAGGGELAGFSSPAK